MSKKLTTPKPNDFRFLVDEYESDNEDTTPSLMESIQTKEKEFKPGQIKKPLTLSEFFLKNMGGKTISTISELADLVDTSIRLRTTERQLYCEKYEAYDRLDPEKYEELVDKRLSCFDSRKDGDFLQLLKENLPKEIKKEEITSLIENAAKSLSKKKPVGHGTLFLLDLMFEIKPELFSIDTFKITHENVQSLGPVILWLVGRTIREESRVILKTNELVGAYASEFLSKELSKSGPFSVYAAHLIKRNIEFRKDSRLNSKNVLVLLKLNLTHPSNLSNRDRHVNQVLHHLLSNYKVNDPQTFASELIINFPECDNKEIFKIFGRAVNKSKPFITGWVKFHQENPQFQKASLQYFAYISQNYPGSLSKFPTEMLQSSGSEYAELILRKKSLKQSSIIFSISLVIFFLLNEITHRFI